MINAQVGTVVTVEEGRKVRLGWKSTEATVPTRFSFKRSGENTSVLTLLCTPFCVSKNISSFLMLFKVEFNGSFRTLVLIDHVIGGKELFLECPLYIHHSTRDLSSGVCGCNPCDMLHETVKEHCSSEPPTIAGFISNSVTHGVCTST